MNVHESSGDLSILSIRSNLVDVMAVAVAMGLGIGLAATGLSLRLDQSGTVQLWLGTLLTVGGCSYLVSKAVPRVNRSFVFEGVLVARKINNEVVPIDRYELATDTARNVGALMAENKALGRAWADGSLGNFDITDEGCPRRASVAAKLAQEAVEYFVLHKFSLHLSDHFNNNPRVSDREIQRIGRQNVSSVLLDNRFLELFRNQWMSAKHSWLKAARGIRPGMDVWFGQREEAERSSTISN